ncbi:MAG: hypothetical protein ABI461_19210, partial [Polyangiaceae bacterium]
MREESQPAAPAAGALRAPTAVQLHGEDAEDGERKSRPRVEHTHHRATDEQDGEGEAKKTKSQPSHGDDESGRNEDDDDEKEE